MNQTNRSYMQALRDASIDVQLEPFRAELNGVRDAINAELRGAGLVLVDRDRWERVREYADANLAWESKDYWGRDTSGGVVANRETTYARLTEAKQRLQPGDLDPIP